MILTPEQRAKLEAVILSSHDRRRRETVGRVILLVESWLDTFDGARWTVEEIMKERQRLARKCADLRDELATIREERDLALEQAARYRSAVDTLIVNYDLPDDAYERSVYPEEI